LNFEETADTELQSDVCSQSSKCLKLLESLNNHRRY